MIRNHDARISLRLPAFCMRSHRLFTAALLIAFLPTTAIAQTIINVPPDPAPTSVGADTILNLANGGAIPDFFDALNGSTVNINGGNVGYRFRARSGSTVDIRGGAFGERFISHSGATVDIWGVDFAKNGVPLSGLDNVGDTLQVNPADWPLLSGTLADGTPFAFGYGNDFANDTLTLIRSAEPAPGPAVINVPGDFVPLGVRAGQTIHVSDGGTVGKNFNAGKGSVVAISGGTVGENLEAVRAEVNISGGAVGNDFDAFDGSTVTITGGTVGVNLSAYDGSTVNVSGGTVDYNLGAYNGATVNVSGGAIGLNATGLGGITAPSIQVAYGSTLNIGGGVLGPFGIAYGLDYRSTVNVTGGTVGHDFLAYYGATVNISGGTIGEDFYAEGAIVNISGGTIGDSFYLEYATANISGGFFGDGFRVSGPSTVEFSALEFLLDGAPIPGLEHAGDSLVLTQRGGSILSGTFRDGTPFDFVLNPNRISGQDTFATNATLRLTLVPEPASVLHFTLGGLTVLTVAIRRRFDRMAA